MWKSVIFVKCLQTKNSVWFKSMKYFSRANYNCKSSRTEYAKIIRMAEKSGNN